MAAPPDDKLPPQELDPLWLDEASRRAAEIDSGKVILISAEDVDHKVRTACHCRYLLSGWSPL